MRLRGGLGFSRAEAAEALQEDVVEVVGGHDVAAVTLGDTHQLGVGADTRTLGAGNFSGHFEFDLDGGAVVEGALGDKEDAGLADVDQLAVTPIGFANFAETHHALYLDAAGARSPL